MQCHSSCSKKEPWDIVLVVQKDVQKHGQNERKGCSGTFLPSS